MPNGDGTGPGRGRGRRRRPRGRCRQGVGQAAGYGSLFTGVAVPVGKAIMDDLKNENSLIRRFVSFVRQSLSSRAEQRREIPQARVTVIQEPELKKELEQQNREVKRIQKA